MNLVWGFLFSYALLGYWDVRVIWNNKYRATQRQRFVAQVTTTVIVVACSSCTDPWSFTWNSCGQMYFGIQKILGRWEGKWICIQTCYQNMLMSCSKA